MKLFILQCLALASSRPPGFTTANAADEPLSPLAMLCKGAGVEIDDVRWRIQAGLDQAQAVEAAIAQRDADAKAKSKAKAEAKAEAAAEPKTKGGK